MRRNRAAVQCDKSRLRATTRFSKAIDCEPPYKRPKRFTSFLLVILCSIWGITDGFANIQSALSVAGSTAPYQRACVMRQDKEAFAPAQSRTAWLETYASSDSQEERRTHPLVERNPDETKSARVKHCDTPELIVSKLSRLQSRRWRIRYQWHHRKN